MRTFVALLAAVSVALVVAFSASAMEAPPNTTVPPDIIFIDEGNCGIALPDGREILNGQGVQRVVFGSDVLGGGGINMGTCWGPTPPGMITETLRYINVEPIDPTPDWACRFTVTPTRWSVTCGPYTG